MLQTRCRIASDTIPRRRMNTSTDSNTQQSCAVGGDTMAKQKNEETEMTCSAIAGPTSMTPRGGDLQKVSREQPTRQRGSPPSVRPSCWSRPRLEPGEPGESGEALGATGRSLKPLPFPRGTYQTLSDTHVGSKVWNGTSFSPNGGETNNGVMGTYLHLSHLPLSRLLSDSCKKKKVSLSSVPVSKL